MSQGRTDGGDLNCFIFIEYVHNFFKTLQRHTFYYVQLIVWKLLQKLQDLKLYVQQNGSNAMNIYYFFLKFQNALVNSLNIIFSWNDKTICSTATKLFHAIPNVEFQISFCTISKMFTI